MNFEWTRCVLEKLAEEKRIPAGFVDLNRAAGRALGRDGTVGSFIARPDIIKERLRASGKGALIGLPAGAGLGLALGAMAKEPGFGALVGALLGATVGADAGITLKNVEQLRRAGIHPKWHALSGELTPEAHRKYLKKK